MKKVNDKLDINRLHRVHMGIDVGRGCGNTTLFATSLIALSQLDEYRFATLHVLFISARGMELTLYILGKTCQMMGVHYRIARKHTVQINDALFEFCIDNPPTRIRHYKTTIFGEEDFQ